MDPRGGWRGDSSSAPSARATLRLRALSPRSAAPTDTMRLRPCPTGALLALTLALPAIAQDATPAELGAAANAALQRGDLEAALEPLEALAELQPASPAVQFQLGRALLAAERYDDAVVAFESVTGPTRPTALYNAACGHSLAGRLDAAVERLRDARDAGFADLGQVETDADLDPLRERDDFAAIVDDLEAELGPPVEFDADAPRTWLDWFIGEWAPVSGLPPSYAQSVEWDLDGTAVAVRTGVSRTIAIWQPEQQIWRLVWASAFGDHDRLEGGLEEDRLVFLQDEIRGQPDQIGRLTYFDARANSYRMLWEVSGDEGATWTPVTRALYRRTAEHEPPPSTLKGPANKVLSRWAFRFGSWHTAIDQWTPGGRIAGRGSLTVALADDGVALVEEQCGYMDSFQTWKATSTRRWIEGADYEILISSGGALVARGTVEFEQRMPVETITGTDARGPYTDTQRYERMDEDHWRVIVDRTWEDGTRVERFTVVDAWRRRG